MKQLMYISCTKTTIVDKKLRSQYSFDSIVKINLIEPTKRNILELIANDKTAFNIKFMTEILKTMPIKPEPNSRMATALAIYSDLIAKGYVSKVDAFETKLTLKGRWHLLATHPHRDMWAIIVAILLTILTILATRENHKSTPQLPSIQELKKNDSVLVRGDSSKLKDSVVLNKQPVRNDTNHKEQKP